MDLIGAMETQSEQSELELDDVVITNPHIEAILENEDWIEDASYVQTCSPPSSPGLKASPPGDRRSPSSGERAGW